MKKWILAAAILCAASLQSASASALSFSSVGGAAMHFDGAGNFTFDNSGTYDFMVTTSPGLFGNLDGTYAIGAVTTSGPVQTAPVTGSGNFTIFDGSTTLHGTVNWIDIYTFNSTGGINSGASVNISAITYTGSNAALTAFANSAASGVITFQFPSNTSLTTLKSTANDSMSYSGTMSSVPEPVTFSLMGVGLLGLGLLRKRIS